MREQNQNLGIPENVDAEMGAYAKELIVDWLDFASKGGSPDMVASEAKLAAEGVLDFIDRGQVLVFSRELEGGFFGTGYLGYGGTNRVVRYINLDPRVVTYFHGFYPLSIETDLDRRLEIARETFIEKIPRIYEHFSYGALTMGIEGREVVGVDAWERLMEVGEE